MLVGIYRSHFWRWKIPFMADGAKKGHFWVLLISYSLICAMASSKNRTHCFRMCTPELYRLHLTVEYTLLGAHGLFWLFAILPHFHRVETFKLFIIVMPFYWVWFFFFLCSWASTKRHPLCLDIVLFLFLWMNMIRFIFQSFNNIDDEHQIYKGEYFVGYLLNYNWKSAMCKFILTNWNRDGNEERHTIEYELVAFVVPWTLGLKFIAKFIKFSSQTDFSGLDYIIYNVHSHTIFSNYCSCSSSGLFINWGHCFRLISAPL